MSECGKEQSPFWQNQVLFAQQTRQSCAWLLGGKCPHCWVRGPWLQGSEGPPVARFGETTRWRSANIAVNSSSQSPWLPAGVYLKIPDVKVTEHFVGPMSTTSQCQSSGKLMYSDEMGLTGTGWKNPPSYHTVVFLSTLVLWSFVLLPLGSVASLNLIGQWPVNKAHLAVDAL